MNLLLYQFDCLEAFPILEAQTTLATPAKASLEQQASGQALRLTVKGGRPTLDAPRLVLALPPRIIEGRPEQMVLQVEGDGSGAQIAIETLDDVGTMASWKLATIDFEGQRDCVTNLHVTPKPTPPHKASPRRSTPRTAQFVRLLIALVPERPDLDIVLHNLQAVGEVHLTAPGIAQK